MTDLDLLAMSRYLVFTGVMLHLMRVMVEAVRALIRGSGRKGSVVRSLVYAPLIGVAGYYVWALYGPGLEKPTVNGVVIVNLFYGLFFMLTAWPWRTRSDDDRFGTPWR